MRPALLLTILLAALFPSLSQAAPCQQKHVAVPLPDETEVAQFIAFLNKDGWRAGDTCKGHYALEKSGKDCKDCTPDALDDYYARWNIRCDTASNEVYALFKGKADNSGEIKYLLASEGGTGHYDSLDALFSKEGATFKLLAPLKEGDGVLPGNAEYSSEAAAMPGHLAYPFLTAACGNTYLNFVDSSWTVDTIRHMKPAVYFWKDGKLTQDN